MIHGNEKEKNGPRQTENKKKSHDNMIFVNKKIIQGKVAELDSLSSGAKMAMKIFVKPVFSIFAINASFLRVLLIK